MIRSERLLCNARFGVLSLAVAAAALLAACSQKTDSAPGETGSTDVVAKVNGDDISAQQLDIALQKRGVKPEQSEAAAKQVLDQLIDEQIIAQKAVAAKLDKDPKVIEQIEAARRDILARRFIEAAADAAAKPVNDQVQKFYDGHPALFAQRKVFTLQHLDIQAPDERRAEIDAHVRSLKSAGELTDWLKAQNLHFNSKQEQGLPEQIPPAILEKLASMKEGESTVIPSQNGIVALTLISSVPAPKTMADARPAIEQFLSVQGRREVVMGLQKTIREGAKIDYEGKFAGTAPAAGDTASSPATVPASSAASAVTAADASASQNNPAQK